MPVDGVAGDAAGIADHAPGNKGLRYPTDPPKVEQIFAVMRTADGRPTAIVYAV